MRYIKAFETFVPKKMDRSEIKDLDKFKVELQKLLEGDDKISDKDMNRITDFWTAQDVLVDNSGVDMAEEDEDDASDVMTHINSIIYKAIANSNK